MLSIIISMLLKTVICQMDPLLVGIKSKGVRGCPEISILVEIQLFFPSNKSPYSDIKLPSFIQQWSFNVLLNDPRAVSFLGLQEFLNLKQVVKDFDASSLVHICRLHKPKILSDMLSWKLTTDLSSRIIFNLAIFVMSFNELEVFMAILGDIDNEGRRSRVKS